MVQPVFPALVPQLALVDASSISLAFGFAEASVIPLRLQFQIEPTSLGFDLGKRAYFRKLHIPRCVIAKSARLRFRLRAAKALLTPLLLLSQRPFQAVGFPVCAESSVIPLRLQFQIEPT